MNLSFFIIDSFASFLFLSRDLIWSSKVWLKVYSNYILYAITKSYTNSWFTLVFRTESISFTFQLMCVLNFFNSSSIVWILSLVQSSSVSTLYTHLSNYFLVCISSSIFFLSNISSKSYYLMHYPIWSACSSIIRECLIFAFSRLTRFIPIIRIVFERVFKPFSKVSFAFFYAARIWSLALNGGNPGLPA